VPAELERRFRINERLLRYLTVAAETPRPQPSAAPPEPVESAGLAGETEAGAGATNADN
jgi:ribosomal protein S6